MHSVFIVVISFATYAAGAVAARRRVSARPPGAVAHPLEVLLVIVALAGIAIFLRPHSPTYICLCAAAMFIIGALIARASSTTRRHVAGGTREYEDLGCRTRPGGAWKRWLNFSRAIVDYEFRLLLVAAYLLLIGPIAIAFRWLRAEPAGSGVASTWMPKSDAPSLDAARRPF